jgi:tetratricopeptide (TPR) repeat protein
LKTKYLIPGCIAALAIGYAAAEYFVPRYFHPPVDETVTARNIIQYVGPKPMNVRDTPAGNYLAGKFAQNRKDWSTASKYMGQIIEQVGDIDGIDELRNHSMVLAMSAGQAEKAVQLAHHIQKNDPDNVLATLFLVMEKFKMEDYAGIQETLDRISEDSIAAFIIPLISLWADTAEGDISTEQLAYTPIYIYHAMLAGRYVDQKDVVKPFVNRGFNPADADIRDIEEFADLFALYGMDEKAIILYQELIDSRYAGEPVEEKLALLKEGQSIESMLAIPDVASPKDGAAVVFMDMAEILVREYSDDSANVFAQMALYLKPELETPRLIIGNIYARYKRFEEAIKVLQTIPASSSNYTMAQRQIAELYVENEQDDKAIAILSQLSGEEFNVEATNQIGDIYRYEEKYDRAVQTYSQIINHFETLPDKYWYVLYARGMSYERLGKYDKAEADLQKALQFRPADPYLLNYLGYSWADQGVNLEEALELIRQAAEIEPGDGYIADSLGWVHYKLGNFEMAVENLENAVELLPYDPTINDHLGDAYWRVGRQKEAQFQWRRALNNMEEEDLELSSRLERKLAEGLSDDSQTLSDLPMQPTAAPKAPDGTTTRIDGQAAN